MDKAFSRYSMDTQASMQQSGVDRISRWYVLVPLLASRVGQLSMSQCLLNALRKSPSDSIPDVLNQTFHDVDINLTKLSEESDGKMHSGCTAVTAFLRLEDSEGKQSFLPSGLDPLALTTEMIEADGDSGSGEDSPESAKSSSKPSKRSKLKNALRSIAPSSHSRRTSQSDSSPSPSRKSSLPSDAAGRDKTFTPTPDLPLRRVLYCANAGDARGVLCRAGKAVRLTYDHKGTDKQEAKRIMDAGGFVMSGRVNGVLAVTRSLGDSSMKEYVVGAPYTTETDLTDEDEFMILACDGVSLLTHVSMLFGLTYYLAALGCGG
jgi:protein phosphatase PTC1